LAYYTKPSDPDKLIGIVRDLVEKMGVQD